jgi:TrmH family RNA methyltransferase
MVKITGKNNPLIADTAKLSSAKHRRETGLFLTEGVKLTECALSSSYHVERVFVAHDKLGEYSPIIDLAQSKGAECIEIGDAAAQKLAAGKTTQGVFAVVRSRKYTIDDASGALIVALEDLSDPGNMGTIIRTADAVGVETILMSSDCVDILNDKVLRASMGSVFNVKTIIADDFMEGLAGLQKKDYALACGHLGGEDFFQAKKPGKNVLIIGNEARGVSGKAAEMCDSLWKLPMRGGAESLNAAVAAGIMMYELTRTR